MDYTTNMYRSPFLVTLIMLSIFIPLYPMEKGYKVPDRKQQKYSALQAMRHVKDTAAPSHRYVSRHHSYIPEELTGRSRLLLGACTLALLGQTVAAAMPDVSLPVCSRPYQVDSHTGFAPDHIFYSNDTVSDQSHWSCSAKLDCYRDEVCRYPALNEPSDKTTYIARTKRRSPQQFDLEMAIDMFKFFLSGQIL